MKKIMTFCLLCIAIFMMGCAPAEQAPPADDVTPPADDVDDTPPTEDNNQVEEEEDGPIELVDEEPEEEQDTPPTDSDSCNSDIPEQNLDRVEITDVVRTDDGFTFYLNLYDAEGNRVLADGNAAIVVYDTKTRNMKLVAENQIYRTSVIIKKDNVLADCTYDKISVSFDGFDVDMMMDGLEEGEEDLGILYVEFILTGTKNYDAEYYPEGKDDSVLPEI